MSLCKVLNNWCIHRYISSSIVKYTKCGLQQGKFMKKLIRNSTPKKKWYPATDPKLPSNSISNFQLATEKRVKRRQMVLNKLFMKHITDLMATGEISREIIGRGIEISRINVTSNFHLVQVFWFSSFGNSEQLKKTTELLNECAYKLRHELSQLRVIGVVPPIQFIKDKSFARTIDLERAISEADYGDDDCTLSVESMKELDDKYDSEIYNIELPPMRHDVLGLDHWKIMTKVKQRLTKRAETAQNRIDSSASTIPHVFDVSQLEMYRTEEENQAFKAFLLERQIQQKRRRKLMKEEYVRELLICSQSADNDQSDHYKDDEDKCNDEYEDDFSDEDTDDEEF